MMDRIIRRVQADPDYFAGLQGGAAAEPEHTASDAISAAARPGRAYHRRRRDPLLHHLGRDRACAPRASGPTCRSWRSPRSSQTARRLALAWGLHCVHTRDVTNFNEMVQHATARAHREGFAEKGQRIVITAGVPFGTPGATNVLRIAWIEG